MRDHYGFGKPSDSPLTKELEPLGRYPDQTKPQTKQAQTPRDILAMFRGMALAKLPSTTQASGMIEG